MAVPSWVGKQNQHVGRGAPGTGGGMAQQWAGGWGEANIVYCLDPLTKYKMGAIKANTYFM